MLEATRWESLLACIWFQEAELPGSWPFWTFTPVAPLVICSLLSMLVWCIWFPVLSQEFNKSLTYTFHLSHIQGATGGGVDGTLPGGRACSVTALGPEGEGPEVPWSPAHPVCSDVLPSALACRALSSVCSGFIFPQPPLWVLSWILDLDD